MKEFNRTDYAGTLRASDVGRTVTVCGWVQRARRLGGLTFVTLRDRTGLLQLNFNAERDAALSELAGTLRTEYVIGATGVVAHRGESAVNRDMPTGEIELYVTALKIFTRADTTPFEILDETECAENLRLKYRYLDLRRPKLQNTIALRHRIAAIARSYFYDNGFLEIETPVLTKSTPEGARDYLVPSRIHPGKFYALPQSPQQYKQLLMLSGFDRYIQIVKCFRDEDLRADRQPEFTQIDLEMSFVDEEDVRAVNEGFLAKLFREVRGIELELPLPCMPWQEAMERFGSDKPDLRFGMELRNITDLVRSCGFKVFTDAAETGSVRLINVDGGAKMTRKEIDSLVEFVRTYRAKGLAWMKINADGIQSSFSKFMQPEELSAIAERAGAQTGDLLLIVADPKDSVVFASLGALRVEVAKRLDRIPKDVYRLLWITDFPMFEWSEEDNRFVAMHHPFTAPKDEDLALLDTDRAHCRAKAYDIVINGYEAGGGSIRIHDPEVQERMFSALGFTREEADERFGHLINAFRYGAPPHGGMAYGLDRLVMLMAGTDNIRDVIAFPKVQTAAELMMNSPDVVEQKQLDELSIAINIKADAE
ncbi:MAG: aspartate--tRNA ligase [Eubacteriales bacterium]|nr:aspartate--tRNA ligase [Clostridiales bacterium]MDY3072121.1 aspartate--tRNA ligase [Eubacteriales bacterium]MDY3286390.1 aspartate--tRNA ligase [Eubacteriales bacterium]MDY5015249.1 aspartate--tRNA ligase [Eubacteriales bacterium]